MPEGDSIRHRLAEIQDGDRSAAASALWKRYHEQLVRFARHKLEGASPQARGGSAPRR
jgi:hypothetical protein